MLSGRARRLLGLYRDEDTLKPVPYYEKLPSDSPSATCLMLDPMLATGDSTGGEPDSRRRASTSKAAVGIIAAPEGIERCATEHPDVGIDVAALDSSSTSAATWSRASATLATASTAIAPEDRLDRPVEERGHVARPRGSSAPTR